MTIIEKIKQSVEGATGMPFLYHAAGELNELIARCGELPVAYSFLIDSGTIDDVNSRYHERVTLAVMFCDKTEFDFNALENEQIIDRMKLKAYKWMQSLRMSNTLRVVSVNNTQRLYDNTTDILTGFAVNITIEDVAGVGECELPEVVIDVDKNGSYDVVGVDKVRVNVVPKLEELEITENGEYLPPTDIAGFSKVVANVLPKITDLVATENDKEYLPADYGADAFGKVKTEIEGAFDIKKVFGTVIPRHPYYYNDTINTEITVIVDGDFLRIPNCDYKLSINPKFDFSAIKYAERLFEGVYFRKGVDYPLHLIDVSSFKRFWQIFYSTTQEEGAIIDVSSWDFTNMPYERLSNGYELRQWFVNSNIYNVVGNRSVEDVIRDNICIYKGVRSNMFLTNNTLDRASLRALINGIADLTGQTTQTLDIGATLIAKLTEEDIAIATAKNWTIA